MKHITIDVPDNKYSFFLELLNNLGIESHLEVPEKDNEAFSNLQQGFKELELAKNGKLKTRSLKDFLDEV